ncbi:MAG: TatD family hydrolase [Rhodospirillales bacterium]|jgi:TatD DNase family protein
MSKAQTLEPIRGLVDSHCHLDYPELSEDLKGVVSRANEAGIEWMTTICTRLDNFPQVLDVAKKYENIFCTVGVHPHEAGNDDDITWERLVKLADHPKVIGLGETGLDYYYERSPRDAQQKAFQAHIDASRETGLPLIVHTRDADDDTARMLREEYAKAPFTGVIHCFSSGREMAEAALEIGFYISISGIVTFKNAQDLRDVVADLPMDRLLVETDSPYLAPVPKRGKPNEPSYTAFTAHKLAEIKGVSAEDLAEKTTNNFFKIFNKASRVGA